MEVIYPAIDGTAGLFISGFRKALAEPTKTEFVGTVLFKRTYGVDSGSGALLPTAASLPIFEGDRPDNLVVNSDFLVPDADGGGTPDGWPGEWDVEASVTAERVHDPDVGSDETLWVLRVSGVAGGRIEQAVDTEQSLAASTYTLSFEVRADVPSPITTVGLEAEGGSRPVTICEIDGTVGTTFAPMHATGTWPSDLAATEFKVVLKTAASSGVPVEYRRVQVESRDFPTQYAPSTTVRYESDLAIYKPTADIVALDHTEVGGASEIRVDGVPWFSRSIGGGPPRSKALFGWEPRVSDTRRGEAGDFSDQADDYPPQWPPPFDRPELDPLPNGATGDVFRNSYFNGFSRDAAVAPHPAGFLQPSTSIEIRRDAGADIYPVQLAVDVVTARLYDYAGSGEDTEAHWAPTEITMNLDTLVVEPAEDRCYAVWRGVWPFVPEKHRRLVVEIQP